MYHELRKPGTRPAMRLGFAAGSFKTQADRSPAELGRQRARALCLSVRRRGCGVESRCVRAPTSSGDRWPERFPPGSRRCRLARAHRVPARLVRLQRAAGACARRSRRVRCGANERHPSQEIPLISVVTRKLDAAFQAYHGALTPTALTDRGSGSGPRGGVVTQRSANSLGAVFSYSVRSHEVLNCRANSRHIPFRVSPSTNPCHQVG
jgi:hypothetical protein